MGESPVPGDLLIGMRAVRGKIGHMGQRSADTAPTTFFGARPTQAYIANVLRTAQRPLVLVFARIGTGHAQPLHSGSEAGGLQNSSGQQQRRERELQTEAEAGGGTSHEQPLLNRDSDGKHQHKSSFCPCVIS